MKKVYLVNVSLIRKLGLRSSFVLDVFSSARLAQVYCDYKQLLERSTSKVCSRCESIFQRLDEKLAVRQRKIESELEKELSHLNLLEFV